MASLLEYLNTTREALKSSPGASLHVVLGNEACDLDSAVSALVYAFLIYSLQQVPKEGEGVVVVPVLNIPRQDYPLKTEVIYWLKKHHIHSQALFFREDVDLSEQQRAGKLQLTLVDHHVLPAADAHLDTSVVFVLDHRKLERRPDSVPGGVVVEMVGSCCTLVAEQILSRNPTLLDAVTAGLLYGTIILDTVNLNEAAKRVTPKDVDIVHRLRPLLQSSVNRNEIFQELTTAKGNVSGLTTEQLLRKDLKVVSAGDLKVGVASVPMMVKKFLEQTELAKTLSDHCISQGYSVLVIMGIDISGETVRRDIAIFSPRDGFRNQLVQHLCEAQDRVLQLLPFESGVDGCSAFLQRNTAASRKVVLPFIKEWLAKKKLDGLDDHQEPLTGH
nr:exopolyphosphatase PRUNE1-like isoform X1 [Procambarus clarkii]